MFFVWSKCPYDSRLLLSACGVVINSRWAAAARVMTKSCGTDSPLDRSPRPSPLPARPDSSPPRLCCSQASFSATLLSEKGVLLLFACILSSPPFLRPFPIFLIKSRKWQARARHLSPSQGFYQGSWQVSSYYTRARGEGE